MNPQIYPGSRATPPGSVRLSIAIVTLSLFLLFVGVVFFLPFFLSPSAIQNDVYMSNLFLAPPFAAGGLVLLFVGLVLFLRSAAAQRMRGRGLWARTMLLALLGAGIVAVASFLVGGHYESFPPGSVYWPPYLNGWELAVTAVVGAAVTVAGWLWVAREPGDERVGEDHA